MRVFSTFVLLFFLFIWCVSIKLWDMRWINLTNYQRMYNRAIHVMCCGFGLLCSGTDHECLMKIRSGSGAVECSQYVMNIWYFKSHHPIRYMYFFSGFFFYIIFIRGDIRSWEFSRSWWEPTITLDFMKNLWDGEKWNST